MYFDLRSVQRRKSKKSKLFVLFAAFAMVVGGLGAPPAGATNSEIFTVIGEPELVLPDIVPMSLVTTRGVPLMVRGTVRALNQVQVYVNTDLSDTIPLSLASTEFEYPLVVDEGVHAVRFLGVSSVPSSSPLDISFDVEYINDTPEPGEQPNPVQSGGAGSGVSSGALLYPGTVEEPVSLGLNPIFNFGLIGGALNNGLISLDFAKPGDNSMTANMLARFVFISVGLFTLIFPQVLLGAYRDIRYRWLGWHRSPLPHFVRHYPLRTLRVVGVALIILVLWLP